MDPYDIEELKRLILAHDPRPIFVEELVNGRKQVRLRTLREPHDNYFGKIAYRLLRRRR